MHKRYIKRRISRLGVLLLFVIASVGASFAGLDKPANAAGYSMQTGYYLGSGAAKTISGLGFQPNLVIIKPTTTLLAVVKTSSMAAANASYMSGTTDLTTTPITLNANGFVLGTAASVNTTNTLYYWTAFGGSDCSATGNFCVGTYTGNGAATRSITSVGFQPTLVMTKQTNTAAMNFRTASMPANRGEFLTTTAPSTTGTLYSNLTATGFDIGVTNNANAGIYNFIAFKSTAGLMNEGTYTGDGLDNRDITGVGFKPNVVFVKNSTSATNTSRRSIMSFDQQNGDSTSFPSDSLGDAQNYIQKLSADGFQVGSGLNANESTFVHYWFAFGGVPTASGASGTFKMATGSYVGTGVAARTINTGTFAPDLVIIKDNAANLMVFRTRLGGDATSYLAGATADFAGGITSLTANGFVVGTNATVNTLNSTYQWQAFGNAYNPETKTGAADFAIGAYQGTAGDDMQVAGAPYQMDFVTVKRNSNTAANFRTSDQAGDLSGFFVGTAEGSNYIQNLNSTGFQVGSATAVNGGGAFHKWFGFKAGTNFAVGSYTGNNVVDRPITIGSGFQPNLLWVKGVSTTVAVSRPGSVSGDVTQTFAAANGAGRVKAFTATGASLGAFIEVNANAVNYRYIAWRIPSSGVLSADIVDGAGASVASPSFAMNNETYPFSCEENLGVIGTTAQKFRISNQTSNAAWSTSIAATDGATALWRNSGNTAQYDYNESSGSPAGCTDGADADLLAGKLRITPTTGTLTPQSGCSTTNVSLGSDQDFNQSTLNSITLLTASSGATAGCYWDLIGVGLKQYIPADQPLDSYSINLTITTIAS